MSARILHRAPPLLVAALVGLAGCASGPTATPDRTTDLTVFAAASLGGALERVKGVYEEANPGLNLTISTDSSAALATRIEQGAPADVFLSADTANPERLADGGFADGAPVVFAGNRLTIITPADNPAALADAFDLAREDVRVIAAGAQVPIQRYALEAVARLADQPGAPARFVEAYTANIVSREDNVSAVRTKIELGEGDAAIVYVTDAAASDRVATIDLPDAANVRARYAGVVVGGARNLEAARAFLAWLAGPAGRAVLAESGFQPPTP